jgi:tRNA threonylcarbamoyl adenosine modification protein (Sua5/YciO/YrdC/YwlC family)
VGEILTSLDGAAAVVDAGRLVVVPTETVYGIAGRPDAHVVDRIFEVKQRPAEKSIQLLVPGAEWLDRVAQPSPDARLLGAAFWPGPLTLVVWARDDAPSAVVSPIGSGGTIGVRVPAHPIALELLARCGPLAASSANRSGEETPPTVDGVRELFGGAVDAYLDGGPAPGTGSTVVDVTTDRVNVLREGPVTTEMLRSVLGSRFEGV